MRWLVAWKEFAKEIVAHYTDTSIADEQCKHSWADAAPRYGFKLEVLDAEHMHEHEAISVGTKKRYRKQCELCDETRVIETEEKSMIASLERCADDEDTSMRI